MSKEHSGRVTTRFGVIRHAQTQWNVEKKIQGQNDSPLTTAGLEQSRIWGGRLSGIKFDRIFSSDLGRTLSTAKGINQPLKLPVAATSRLRELDWGSWTGKRLQEVKAKTPDVLKRMEKAGWQFCAPGGETREAVWQRARAALLSATHRWPGETILTVTHEGVIKCLLYRLEKREFLPQEPALILPYHLHWLVVRDRELAIEQINAIEL